MQIVDLRQVHSKTLDVLFQEEARHWRDELHWDYRPSIDLIRKFIDSRSLNGYLALDNGRPAGYGFYVLEDHKGLIGGLFVSSEYAQSPITQRHSGRNVDGPSCHAAPRTDRSAADAVSAPSLIPHFFRNIYGCIRGNSCCYGLRMRS